MLELVFIRLEINQKCFANGAALRSSEKRYGRWVVWGHPHCPLHVPSVGSCIPAPWLPWVKDGLWVGSGWVQGGPTTSLLCYCRSISGVPSHGEPPRLQPWRCSCQMCRAALGIHHSTWVWAPTSLLSNFIWWAAWIIQKELFIQYRLSCPWLWEVTRVRCYCHAEKLAKNLTFLSIWESCITLCNATGASGAWSDRGGVGAVWPQRLWTAAGKTRRLPRRFSEPSVTAHLCSTQE